MYLLQAVVAVTPDATHKEVLPTDERHVLVGEPEGLHDAFEIVAKNAVAVHDLDLGDSRVAMFHVQVRDVHTLLGQGLGHVGAPLVISHDTGKRGIHAHAPEIDRHVNGIASWIALALLLVYVDAVVACCCNLHALPPHLIDQSNL